MSRIDPELTQQVLGRLPNEGFQRLCKRPPEESAPLKRATQDWELVRLELRAVFGNLGNGKSRWPLYLFGAVGVGKTCAVRAFADRVAQAYYWTIDRLMETVPTGPPWLWYRAAELAILDELGLPRVSDAARNYDYDCLKRFLDWREHKPAIYVSNHTLQAIEQLYDKRIASRLGAGTVFELRDSDRRKPVP
jgi:DNA replication protein DnaC